MNTVSIMNELYSNKIIHLETNSITMRETFLHETSFFINKWVNKVVLIDICIAINDVERNGTNLIALWSEMGIKKVINCDENIQINN